MRPTVGFISATAVAAAVAGVSATPAVAAVPGPCQLVTTANATKFLGRTFPKPETSGGSRECLYYGARGVIVVAERQQSRSSFDAIAKKDPGPVVHIAGIGSDAYSINHGKTLLLWKNGTEVTVVASPNPLKTEEAIGKIAAARL